MFLQEPLAATEKIRELGLAEFIARYKLRATRDQGLVSLKYDMIESPMHEPCVADCRGLVVDEAEPTRVVAMAFRKFWNFGEPHADTLDWRTARVTHKLDGSLMTLYRWRDQWHVASSGHPTAGGSFGRGGTRTFRDVFWEIFRARGYALPETHESWFTFELLHPENRIVVRYDEPRLVLLLERNARTFAEASSQWMRAVAVNHNWDVVDEVDFDASVTSDQVRTLAASTNPLKLEGYVASDVHGRRVKIKNAQYVALHQLRGQSSPRAIVELWQAGELSEILAHFPDLQPDIDAVVAPIEAAIAQVAAAWAAHGHLTDRKAFALAVQAVPFNVVLFRALAPQQGPAPGTPHAALLTHFRSCVRGLTTAAILRTINLA